MPRCPSRSFLHAAFLFLSFPIRSTAGQVFLPFLPHSYSMALPPFSHGAAATRSSPAPAVVLSSACPAPVSTTTLSPPATPIAATLHHHSCSSPPGCSAPDPLGSFLRRLGLAPVAPPVPLRPPSSSPMPARLPQPQSEPPPTGSLRRRTPRHGRALRLQAAPPPGPWVQAKKKSHGAPRPLGRRRRPRRPAGPGHFSQIPRVMPHLPTPPAFSLTRFCIPSQETRRRHPLPWFRPEAPPLTPSLARASSAQFFAEGATPGFAQGFPTSGPSSLPPEHRLHGAPVMPPMAHVAGPPRRFLAFADCTAGRRSCSPRRLSAARAAKLPPLASLTLWEPISVVTFTSPPLLHRRQLTPELPCAQSLSLPVPFLCRLCCSSTEKGGVAKR